MNDNGNNGKKLDDLERAALVVSGTFLGFFVIYWGFQIQSTIELLSMAYGW